MLASGALAHAATVPAGFVESLVAGNLANPTAMQFAPDGRLFVCEQGGRLRVIKNGALLPTPFATVPVNAFGERGLLGVAFDPDFSTNQYVYVYYTATTPTIHNRISRFTANGDVAVAGSEVVILELDNLGALNHNGGAIHFGTDGKLYAAVGDNANGANAQSLTSLHGKMLRIDKDGTIPTDNPFYGSATGKYRAIWALGLRNPFTFSMHPVTGASFVNDVGEGAWEEINDGVSGANYGWPATEGYTTDPRFNSPRYAYNHADGSCAITGGAFYQPLANQFPAGYLGDYFFADYCSGWIHTLDPAGGGNTVVGFATGIPAPVDLKVAADGSLYYLERGWGSTTGAVHRIDYGASVPTITAHPAHQTVRVGAPATFSVLASGTGPLRYQWQRNGGNIAGATASSYTIGSVALADEGARFRAIVTNDFGDATSDEAVLTVTTNQPPSATIIEPAVGTLYSAGDVITFAGAGTDPEDGVLSPAAFTWQVDFHHAEHIHPFIPPTTGATAGSFSIPTTGHTETNVWYRIYLTVRDADAETHTTYHDLRPRTSRITLTSSPPGLQLKLDGQPIQTPVSFDGVVGVIRNLEAVSPQTIDGVTWNFDVWSDGGSATHDIATPSSDTTYTAAFAEGAAISGLVGYWDMNAVSVSGSTLSDRSGGGSSGTILGATLAAGMIGESLAFDGGDDRVDIVGAPALDTVAGFTIAFWYRAVVNFGSIVAKPYGAAWLNSWQFEFNGPSLSFTSSDGTNQHFDVTAAPGAGTWIHVAGSWDGVTKKLFVNGVRVLAVPRAIAVDTRDVVIGGDYNNGQFLLPFNGSVDEVRVYDRALSDGQVQQLYQGVFAPDTDAPSIPTGVATTLVTTTRIDLTWQAATDNVAVAGYRVFRDGVAMTTVAGTSYSDIGLSPATSYSYEVTAFDAANNESAKSNAVIATTAAPPPPPVLTSITVVPGSASVMLGGTQQFTAQGHDQYGSPMAATVTWDVAGGGTISTGGLFTAATAGGPFIVTAQSGSIAGTATVTVTTRILESHFDTGADGFAYLDNPFRGTTASAYASGAWSGSGGFSGGGLRVTLGGINNTTVLGMSGGWRRTFALAAATPVVLSFRYRLTQSSEYEPDEISETLVRVDSLQPGTGGTDYVARLIGNGNGGTPRTTNWQLFQVNLGTLAAGTHTLTVGGYNNKKTLYDETTEVVIDDIEVTAVAPPPPPVLTSIIVAPGSASVTLGGTQQFTAQGYDQFGSPMATTVTWTVSGGGTMSAGGLFTADTAGGPFIVTAQSGAIAGTAAVTVITRILEAHFDAGADGFVYLDNPFRGTTASTYASGAWSAAQGFSGGGLKVTLGGINDTTVLGMSGGWRRTFALSAATPAVLSFRYALTQSANYESDEVSEVLVRVDGLQPGTGGTDYVARLVGDGNGGSARTTSWQLFQVDLGTLAAGTHTLTIGGYNNKKTLNDEITDILIDDVDLR
jgi:glucose/arabinose dehydrogenase